MKKNIIQIVILAVIAVFVIGFFVLFFTSGTVDEKTTQTSNDGRDQILSKK